jgi:ubiquinone/menaquinone biosynthesis C-methylase UbiE
MFAPITDALIAEARIIPGHSVLDVGTGPGEPALTVAKVMGPEGSVTGIDPTEEMIAAARRAAAREGVNNVKFEVASADRLVFGSESFDYIVSRFSAMFFPAPVEGNPGTLASIEARRPDGVRRLVLCGEKSVSLHLVPSH